MIWFEFVLKTKLRQAALNCILVQKVYPAKNIVYGASIIKPDPAFVVLHRPPVGRT